MKLAKVFLIMVCNFSSISITSCALSKFKSSTQPSTSPTAPASSQHDQPSVTPSDQGAESKATTSETATGANEITDDLHTPTKGSAERQAIMDALREEFNNRKSGSYQPHRGTITFVVNYLKVHNGWAWTYADPKSSDPSEQFG